MIQYNTQRQNTLASIFIFVFEHFKRQGCFGTENRETTMCCNSAVWTADDGSPKTVNCAVGALFPSLEGIPNGSVDGVGMESIGNIHSRFQWTGETLDWDSYPPVLKQRFLKVLVRLQRMHDDFAAFGFMENHDMDPRVRAAFYAARFGLFLQCLIVLSALGEDKHKMGEDDLRMTFVDGSSWRVSSLQHDKQRACLMDLLREADNFCLPL